MIGYALYNDDRNKEVVVQLQNSEDYVGEISISYDYACGFSSDVQLIAAYVQGLIEIADFIEEEMKRNELPETEQEQ